MAAQALASEEARHSAVLGAATPYTFGVDLPHRPWRRQVIVPMIVTTARLRLAKFDPSTVDRRTGEVPFDEIELRRLPFLVYEYPIPSHLQSEPRDLARALVKEGMHKVAFKSILVVNSDALGGALEMLRGSAEVLIDGWDEQAIRV